MAELIIFARGVSSVSTNAGQVAATLPRPGAIGGTPRTGCTVGRRSAQGRDRWTEFLARGGASGRD